MNLSFRAGKTLKAGCVIASAFFVLSAAAQNTPLFDYSGPAYSASPEGITGNNTGRYHNRPLYANNTDAFVASGDQPLPTLVQNPYVLGSLLLAAQRDGRTLPLTAFTRITSHYRAGMMSWVLESEQFPSLSLRMEAVPISGQTGMAVRLEAPACQAGDRLVWAYGGAYKHEGNLNHDLDPSAHPEIMAQGFDAQACQGNEFFWKKNNFTLSCEGVELLSGTCSEPGTLALLPAASWSQAGAPAQATNRTSGQKPGTPVMIGSRIALKAGKPVYWAVWQEPGAMKADSRSTTGKGLPSDDPETLFASGKARAEALQNRIRVHTPDAELNALASAGVGAIDGIWYPPVFRHGAMLWNLPFPGWRSVFGAIALGWHERVTQSGQYYLSHQIKQSDKTEARADSSRLYVDQAPDSRFYGVGYLDKDQTFYNMQSQFFDQLISGWRASGDPKLEEVLYPALELHLQWARECFDPDGDGLYECYRNCWPTDSHWYSGGGSAEETAYAYRGHRTAAEMARRRGDSSKADFHEGIAEKIRDAFHGKLWMERRGHPAKLVEQSGLQRQHPDPWLYSLFLPATAGLTEGDRSAEALYYSEYALENVSVPSGGTQVYTSNFVPALWSVRVLWPGDNHHLALAYAQGGLSGRAWDLFRGTFVPEAFHGAVPGSIGHPCGGTDFSDCSNMFYRMLSEGLFGYRPDYPNGKVTFAPCFPEPWPEASIELPDFTLSFHNSPQRTEYFIGLTRSASMEVLIPINTPRVHRVTLNGKETDWEMLPGYGKNHLRIQVPEGREARIEIRHAPLQPYTEQIEGTAVNSEAFTLNLPGVILSLDDPQGILTASHWQDSTLNATVRSDFPHHTLIATVRRGDYLQKQLIRLSVSDPNAQAHRDSLQFALVPAQARWASVGLSEAFNADVRKVYQQQYLSPRPNTVSLRLGSDGYSSWCFPYWECKPPRIGLDSLDGMCPGDGRLHTPQGVPFVWNPNATADSARNVAFTSRWDNYPDRLSVPVGRRGEALWMLICGTTTPMQCQIANAVLRLHYEDGTTDSLELVPPVNYWNLSPIQAIATAPGQGSRSDYTAPADRFCLPEQLPPTVQMGENCRAMLLNRRMRPGVTLERVELETLSGEVIVGLMGLSVMNPEP